MPLSRRSFFGSFARSRPSRFSAAAVAERGREAAQAARLRKDAGAEAPVPPIAPDAIRLDSNENPLGPSPAALRALGEALDRVGRYPTNTGVLRDAIARKLQVRPENVVVGNGSGELLRVAARVFTSSARHLITAAPTFESPERMADALAVPVKSVPVDQAGRLDLEKMAAAARWAGLVFVCNPNNPTGGVHSFATIAEFVGRLRREAPETAILIDEAYHDYVDDPGYGTALALALEHPNVFVTRTFSKAHGMAGLRVGYAVGQARTVEALQRWVMTFSTNSPAQAAALASLRDQAHVERERARNSEVRTYAKRFFDELGRKTLESQTNFLFVETEKPAKQFREACLKQGVVVGREFPPFEKSWARISLGTMEEMKKATAVFAQVLGSGALAAATPQGGAR